MKNRRALVLGGISVVWIAAAIGACSINPQPLPPETASDSGALSVDGSTNFGQGGGDSDATSTPRPGEDAGNPDASDASDAEVDGGDGGDAD